MMRRTIAYVVVLVLAAATGYLVWQNHQLHLDNTDVEAKHQAAEKSYTDALGAIAEIQDSLSALGVSEAKQPVLPGSPEAEHGLSLERGREALDRIALIKAGISRTRERIAQLETRLRKSGLHVASLEHMIVNLKRDVVDRETRIAALATQVDSLHTTVNGLNETVASNQQTIQQDQQKIEQQRTELGTMYVAIGDKRKLTDAGLVKPVGGMLGIGRTLQLTGKTDGPIYSSLDSDVASVIRIPSAKARVLTAQPSASYMLVPSGNETELHILNATAFRAVRYVVILTS